MKKNTKISIVVMQGLLVLESGLYASQDPVPTPTRVIVASTGNYRGEDGRLSYVQLDTQTNGRTVVSDGASTCHLDGRADDAIKPTKMTGCCATM